MKIFPDAAGKWGTKQVIASRNWSAYFCLASVNGLLFTKNTVKTQWFFIWKDELER